MCLIQFHIWTFQILNIISQSFQKRHSNLSIDRTHLCEICILVGNWASTKFDIKFINYRVNTDQAANDRPQENDCMQQCNTCLWKSNQTVDADIQKILKVLTKDFIFYARTRLLFQEICEQENISDSMVGL